LQHRHHLLALSLVAESTVAGGDLDPAAIAGTAIAGNNTVSADLPGLARPVALLAQTDPELLGTGVDLLDDVPHLLQRGGIAGMNDELVMKAAEASLLVRENLLQATHHFVRSAVVQSLSGDF